MIRTPMAIAVDVGGTSARLALVTRRGRVSAAHQFATGRRMSVAAFLQHLAPAIQTLIREASRVGGVPVGIGIGVPGVVDVPRGAVRYVVNLPQWRDIPLRRLVARSTRLPTTVDNDVNLMTWGEFCWGAGRGARSLLCVMLGTGVGGGLILSGRLYRGWTMSAGEIGHVPLGLDGPRCPCGGRGCLERYVGNQAILALVRRKIRSGRRSILTRLVHGNLWRLTPPLIDQAAHRGDRLAREVWREVGATIGVALTMAVNVINPERIVIGGGIARAGELLFPAIRATVRSRAMPGAAAVPIVPARWGAEAGLVGAAAIVLAPYQGEGGIR